MADLATLKTKLTQFEDAYDALLLGQTVVKISDGDLGSVEYTAAAAPAIKRRINELKAAIASLEGTARGAFYQRFG
jgi:hypothetical protein